MRRRRIDPKPPFSQSAPAGKRAQSASVRFSGAIRCGISTTSSRANWHRLEYPPPRCYAGAGQTTDRRRQARHRMPRSGPATRRRRDNQTGQPRTCTALRNDKRRRSIQMVMRLAFVWLWPWSLFLSVRRCRRQSQPARSLRNPGGPSRLVPRTLRAGLPIPHAAARAPSGPSRLLRRTLGTAGPIASVNDRAATDPRIPRPPCSSHT